MHQKLEIKNNSHVKLEHAFIVLLEKLQESKSNHIFIHSFFSDSLIFKKNKDASYKELKNKITPENNNAKNP